MLGRDLGLELELSDVECDSLLPAELKDWSPSGDTPIVEQLCKALEPYDASTAERVTAMLADDVVPVQLSMVDVWPLARRALALALTLTLARQS